MKRLAYALAHHERDAAAAEVPAAFEVFVADHDNNVAGFAAVTNILTTLPS